MSGSFGLQTKGLGLVCEASSKVGDRRPAAICCVSELTPANSA
jgi:hypothetical protein